jgi:hypothetical protein
LLSLSLSLTAKAINGDFVIKIRRLLFLANMMRHGGLVGVWLV